MVKRPAFNHNRSSFRTEFKWRLSPESRYTEGETDGNSFPEFFLGWTAGRMNFVLTLALTCVLSPGERISPFTVLVIQLTVRQIPSQVFQMDGE